MNYGKRIGETTSDFDSRPGMPRHVSSVFERSNTDYTQFHPNSTWGHFRKNWNQIEVKEQTEQKDDYFVPNDRSDITDKYEDIYAGFLLYFGDLIMTKFKYQGEYSLYSAQIQCLCNDKRYVFVVVKDDYPLGSEVPLSKLNWDSFQTRTLKENYIGQIQGYPAKTNRIMETPIIKEKETEDKRTMYKVPGLPLTVEMLSKQRTNRSYTDVGTIGLSLETFNTVVNIIK